MCILDLLRVHVILLSETGKKRSQKDDFLNYYSSGKGYQTRFTYTKLIK